MGLKWLWFCLVSAAAFFVTYECTKSLLGAGGALAEPRMAPVTHMLAASLGEIVSLLISHTAIFCLLLPCVCDAVSLSQHTFTFFFFFFSVGLNDSQSFQLFYALVIAFFYVLSPRCFFPTAACPK